MALHPLADLRGWPTFGSRCRNRSRIITGVQLRPAAPQVALHPLADLRGWPTFGSRCRNPCRIIRERPASPRRSASGFTSTCGPAGLTYFRFKVQKPLWNHQRASSFAPPLRKWLYIHLRTCGVDPLSVQGAETVLESSESVQLRPAAPQVTLHPLADLRGWPTFGSSCRNRSRIIREPPASPRRSASDFYIHLRTCGVDLLSVQVAETVLESSESVQLRPAAPQVALHPLADLRGWPTFGSRCETVLESSESVQLRPAAPQVTLHPLADLRGWPTFGSRCRNCSGIIREPPASPRRSASDFYIHLRTCGVDLLSVQVAETVLESSESVQLRPAAPQVALHPLADLRGWPTFGSRCRNCSRIITERPASPRRFASGFTSTCGPAGLTYFRFKAQKPL